MRIACIFKYGSRRGLTEKCYPLFLVKISILLTLSNFCFSVVAYIQEVLMTKSQRLLLFILLFNGICFGFLISRSWLHFFSVLVGVALAVAGLTIRYFLGRRKKMRVRRPQLETFLDEMIQLVEHPTRPLERMIVYNASCRGADGDNIYNLQVHGGGQSYLLNTMTIAVGRHIGWMNVHAGRYGDEGNNLRLEFPDLGGFARPESWLISRLEKLRALVGNVSICEARRQLLKKYGVTTVEDADLEKDINKLGKP